MTLTQEHRNETVLTVLPTTEETAPETAHAVKTRAVSGVKVLAARTLVSVLLRVVSSLCLAHLLFPKDYGLFGVVSYITGLGMFLSDVGLGYVLVRQEAKPTRDESFTVFCTQQAVTGLVVFAVIITAPFLIHLYALSPSAKTLLYAMAFGLLLSSLRIVPMMALERDLQFATIAKCEMAENLVQTSSTIVFAYFGCGAWSLAIGGLLRGVVGLVLVWGASPWFPSGRFDLAIVRRLAKFGIPFQLNAILPTLLGGWMPLVVGRVLGIAAVGLVGWASNIASVPMMLSGVLNRVAFPAYSRLQSDPEALGLYLAASIRRISVVFSLVIPLFVIVCPVAIPILFHSRWIPAIPLVQWFSLECIALTLTGLLAATQSAIGHPSDRLLTTIVVGALRWGCGYFAVSKFGLFGIGPVMFFISFAEMCVSSYQVKHRSLGCAGIMRTTIEPFLTVGIMLAVAMGADRMINHQNAVIKMCVAAVTFFGLILLREVFTGGRLLSTELKAIWSMMRRQA